jgi:hypothetical protein
VGVREEAVADGPGRHIHDGHVALDLSPGIGGQGAAHHVVAQGVGAGAADEHEPIGRPGIGGHQAVVAPREVGAPAAEEGSIEDQLRSRQGLRPVRHDPPAGEEDHERLARDVHDQTIGDVRVGEVRDPVPPGVGLGGWIARVEGGGRGVREGAEDVERGAIEAAHSALGRVVGSGGERGAAPAEQDAEVGPLRRRVDRAAEIPAQGVGGRDIGEELSRAPGRDVEGGAPHHLPAAQGAGVLEADQPQVGHSVLVEIEATKEGPGAEVGLP